MAWWDSVASLTPVAAWDALHFSNGQSQTLTLTHQGGGQWAAAGGPLAGSGTMPDASTVTVTVRADGPGGTATDTTSFTLHRPASC